MMAPPEAVSMNSSRAGSVVAFAAGIVLVFIGWSSALGFTLAGMVASGATIATLLYAGGVWLGPTPPRARSEVVLFTRALTVASGPSAGRSVVELFPESVRAVIAEHCRTALEGRAVRFTSPTGEPFAVSPVHSAEGAIIFGLLLSGQAAEAAASAVTSVV
jgi:hypothetical protein